ncbi:MAG TPA: FxLYD domain-containing protein [Nitrolancea sp.]
MGLTRKILPIVAVLALCLIPSMQSASAADFGSYAFERVWNRTDQPVAAGKINRTWMWGPKPFTGVLLEPYVEGNVAGEKGVRRVQYFDKSRMEITDSTADPNSDWYVANGLLAKELITGEMQVGNSAYVDYGPAEIDLAGDENDPNAPTYATFNSLMNYKPLPLGWKIMQTVDRHGNVGNDASAGALDVTAAKFVPQTNHDIASVFWDFMNSSGVTYDGFQYTNAPLFSDPFFATGFPITEAYWTTVKIGGTPHRVLVQAFERRVLTYTPDNADGWKVESGNVGRHYYEWRYGSQSSSALTTSAVTSSKDLNGNWIFLGQVKNGSKAGYDRVTVTVELYSAQQKLIASKTAYLDFTSIAPGQSLPFRVWFDSGPAYDHAVTKVTGTVSPLAQATNLTLKVINSQYLASGDYHVTANVQNDTEQPLTRPSYVVTLYRQDGTILDYNAGFLSLDTLQPGANAQIDVTFYDPASSFTGFKVFVSQ